MDRLTDGPNFLRNFADDMEEQAARLFLGLEHLRCIVARSGNKEELDVAIALAKDFLARIDNLT